MYLRVFWSLEPALRVSSGLPEGEEVGNCNLYPRVDQPSCATEGMTDCAYCTHRTYAAEENATVAVILEASRSIHF